MAKYCLGFVALAAEVAGAALVAIGAVQALIALGTSHSKPHDSLLQKKEVWVHFGVWLLLGLEFELAADIVRTAIAPTWNQLGQLATIAVIRTFLNYFLERDIEKLCQAGIAP